MIFVVLTMVVATQAQNLGGVLAIRRPLTPTNP